MASTPQHVLLLGEGVVFICNRYVSLLKAVWVLNQLVWFCKSSHSTGSVPTLKDPGNCLPPPPSPFGEFGISGVSAEGNERKTTLWRF